MLVFDRTMKRRKQRKTKVAQMKKNKLTMIHEHSAKMLPSAQSFAAAAAAVASASGGSTEPIPTSLADIKLVSGGSKRSGKPRDASSRRSSFSSVMESDTYTDVDGTEDVSESNDNWDDSDKDEGEFDF